MQIRENAVHNMNYWILDADKIKANAALNHAVSLSSQRVTFIKTDAWLDACRKMTFSQNYIGIHGYSLVLLALLNVLTF